MAKKSTNGFTGPHYNNDPDPATIRLANNCSDNERQQATRYVIAKGIADGKIKNKVEHGVHILSGELPLGIIAPAPKWKRKYDENRAKIGTYNPKLYQPITVALLNDMVQIIDGTQRAASAANAKMDTIEARWIFVSSEIEKADLVWQLMQHKKPETDLERHKARLASRELYATLTSEILTHHTISNLGQKLPKTIDGRSISHSGEIRLCRCAEEIDKNLGTGNGALAEDFLKWFLEMLENANWLVKTNTSLSPAFITAIKETYIVATTNDNGQKLALFTTRILNVLSQITPDEFYEYADHMAKQRRASIRSQVVFKEIAKEILTKIRDASTNMLTAIDIIKIVRI